MDRTRWDYITTYGRTRTHHSWCASAVDSVYLSALDFRFLHLHQFLDPHLFTGILYITCIYTYIFTHTHIYIYTVILYISCTPSTGHPLDHFLKLRPEVPLAIEASEELRSTRPGSPTLWAPRCAGKLPLRWRPAGAPRNGPTEVPRLGWLSTRNGG